MLPPHHIYKTSNLDNCLGSLKLAGQLSPWTLCHEGEMQGQVPKNHTRYDGIREQEPTGAAPLLIRRVMSSADVSFASSYRLVALRFALALDSIWGLGAIGTV